MSSLMLEPIWRIIELFLTKAALKRFFSSVGPHMNFQIFMPRKSLTTFTTNMRFFLKIGLLRNITIKIIVDFQDNCNRKFYFFGLLRNIEIPWYEYAYEFAFCI